MAKKPKKQHHQYLDEETLKMIEIAMINKRDTTRSAFIRRAINTQLDLDLKPEQKQAFQTIERKIVSGHFFKRGK
jgi:hypothetical protein